MVNGEVWQDATSFVPTHRRPLGYVFQEASLFPHLTAAGNLDYAIKRATNVSDDLHDQVIETMGLGGLLRRLPNALSGGERQRVAIARALLIQPRLLLMDEPMASLDAARKQEILPYLRRLRDYLDIPTFYVSHSVDEVAQLADHVVILENGRVTNEGSVVDVFSGSHSAPRTEEETGVILQGEVVEHDARWHLARIAIGGGIKLWVRDRGDTLGATVRVRILARDVSITLASHEDSSILNRLPAEVAALEPDPDAAMIMVRMRVGADYLIARITRRSAEHLALQPGKSVWAQAKSAAIVR